MYLIKAPAKVILFGEHAVVYDQPCIVGTLAKYTFCYITPSDRLECYCPDIQLSYNGTYTASKALDAFLHLVNLLEIKSVKVVVRSEIPVGQGLGSSASYAVCLSTALLLYLKRITLDALDYDLINKYAFEAEKQIHGTPSGVDNTIITFGGYYYYTRSNYHQLESCSSLRILVIDSKIEKDTKYQVQKYRKRKEGFKAMELVTEAIGNISTQSIDVFKTNDVEKMETLIQMNQGLLYASGMSIPEMDDVIRKSNELGLASKITGAGGGGCLLTLLKDGVEDKVVELKEYLSEKRMEGFETRLGVEGVQVLPCELADFLSTSFEQLSNKWLR